MLGILEHAEEDKSTRHAGIEAPDKDDSRYHERIRDFLVGISEDAECGCDHVLVACISIND